MITREAVLHIPLSQYAFAGSGGIVTFRLRAAKDNLASCTLYYGDRADRQTPVRFTAVEMAPAAGDELFTYFECSFKAPYERICYYFELCAGGECSYYYADLFAGSLPTERSEFYQYPFLRREEISDVPAWFKGAVVYNIFPDSFASGPRSLVPGAPHALHKSGVACKSKLGGTINGVRENLDYIQGLGCNCVYLNPIFAAGEYHKYDLVDYYSIDPAFGTNEDFRFLVEEVHERGMRIIIDGVFNHVGWDFFAFRDVVEKGEASPYKEWFYRLAYPVERPEDEEAYPTYSCFAYERKMPKLNTANPEVVAYFMDVCRHWMREYHIDGWRLDVANEVDKEFWRAFRRTAKAQNPDCILIAEVWENAEVWLRGDMFDSAMNYDMRKHCREFFARGSIDAAAFDGRATQMRMRYPTGILEGQLNLLDSHDVARFLSLCEGDERRLRLALLFLVLFPGAPSIFYGDEKGMAGVTEAEYRAPMAWDKPAEALTSFFQQALALRRFEAVQTGSYTTLCAEAGSRLYAFARRKSGQSVTAVLNAGDVTAPVPQSIAQGKEPLLAQGLQQGDLAPFGYAVWASEE